MAGGSSPCASCKLLRRRCSKDCIFSPYFPSDDPYKFAIVHKVFGASNISKMLQELPFHQRSDAVSSLVYEATARMRDPVYGCVGAISYLQSQISQLQMQLAVAEAEIFCIQMQQDQPAAVASLSTTQPTLMVEDDDKSFFFNNITHNNNNNLMNNNLNMSHLLNYSSSSSTSNSVIHDYSLRERESLWT